MPEYVISEQAKDELFDVFLFGIEKFGAKRAQEYQTSLEKCFELIALNPLMGRDANLPMSGMRRHEHESHIIFYRVLELGIRINAIKHKSMIADFDDAD